MNGRRAMSIGARCAALWLTLALVGCGGPQPPWNEPPALQLDLVARVEPTSVRPLQPIAVTLDLYRARGVDVAFTPEVDEERFVVDRRLVLPEQLFGDGFWQRTQLVLLPLAAPGEVTLAPFVATAADGSVSAATREQVLTIESALGEHGEAIEAPGDPFAAPSRAPLWLAAGTAALLLLAVLGYALRRRRAATPAAAVALPPHVLALRELQRMLHAPRTTPTQIEAFYVGVSRVLRVYVEQRFGLAAPERTTEEFLRELEGGDELARRHRRELERFLAQCDLVKFAAVVPDEREHRLTWELAHAFVESTRGDAVDGPARDTPVREEAVH